MDTPVCDFVSAYIRQAPLRLHMPGHKGVSKLGMEAMDLTEIHGADSLFHADGIIRQSEENAGNLFGCHTFYSAEGSSLCIRAMLYLCVLHAKSKGQRPLIAAARNVHTTFISAAALLDFDIHWLYPNSTDTYLRCTITAEELEKQLCEAPHSPVALYLTSPDYLGNMADLPALSQVCRRHGILLVVDNAHGAYLKFLPTSLHPMDQGADLCCDSAHKTFPVLTGGAYLHINRKAPPEFWSQAKQAMSLFASTSPSYLILQSLDAVNADLEKRYPEQLASFLVQLNRTRQNLMETGYQFIGNEPLKMTIDCKPYGYTGNEMAALLMAQNVYPEFYDPDYLVLMLTPEVGTEGLLRMEAVLRSIPKRIPIRNFAPVPGKGKQILTPREAAMSPAEIVPVSDSLGRILASPSVGCPPAVPIAVCGEIIDETAIACFSYYGISHCNVVK